MYVQLGHLTQEPLVVVVACKSSPSVMTPMTLAPMPRTNRPIPTDTERWYCFEAAQRIFTMILPPRSPTLEIEPDLQKIGFSTLGGPEYVPKLSWAIPIFRDPNQAILNSLIDHRIGKPINRLDVALLPRDVVTLPRQLGTIRRKGNPLRQEPKEVSHLTLHQCFPRLSNRPLPNFIYFPFGIPQFQEVAVAKTASTAVSWVSSLCQFSLPDFKQVATDTLNRIPGLQTPPEERAVALRPLPAPMPPIPRLWHRKAIYVALRGL